MILVFFYHCSVTFYNPVRFIAKKLLVYIFHLASIFNCQRFISSGCLSYIITATSSLCDEMRRAAYHSLSLFNEHLTAAKFKEKYQVSLSPVLLKLLSPFVVYLFSLVCNILRNTS